MQQVAHSLHYRSAAVGDDASPLRLYQSLVLPFQRRRKPKSFVVLNFTCVQLWHLLANNRHVRYGSIRHLAGICLVSLSIGS